MRLLGTRVRLVSAARAFALAAVVFGATACAYEVGAAYPVDYDGYYPPDAYVATTEPVYYEGRPLYWYGGRWYYREGGRWAHYTREPPALYQRRMQAPPQRHAYEPSRGRAPGRSRPGRHR